jgi:hypothetical protein
MASETDEAPVPLPPVVYVPARQPGPGDSEVTLEMRALEDGRVALLVYSAVDRLVAACGEHQPWALLPTARLEELQGQDAEWDVVLLDPHLPEELRHAGDEPAGQEVTPRG